MQKKWFKIVVFVCALFIFAIGTEGLIDFGLKQNKNIKASYIQNKKIDSDILIHGPCEPLWMVSPKIISTITKLSSYNLALSHSDFADNYLHFYLYLKNNKAPRYLFLYVTPESMDTLFNTFNTYRFVPYLSDAQVKEVIKDCDKDYYNWLNVPFMKYAYYNHKLLFSAIQGYKHYFVKKQLPYFPDGFEPPAKISWDNHLEEFIQLYPNGYYFNWSNKREKYLRKIIELAQKKGTNVFLYESPVLKEALVHQPNRNDVLSRINLLAENYKIQYLKFDKMKMAESRKYFISTLNLNLEGGELFTDSLAKYIKFELLDKKK